MTITGAVPRARVLRVLDERGEPVPEAVEPGADARLTWRLWDGEPEGPWAVVLTALCPTYFLFSHVTMAEVPFMLASTATLLAATRTAGETLFVSERV